MKKTYSTSKKSTCPDSIITEQLLAVARSPVTDAFTEVDILNVFSLQGYERNLKFPNFWIAFRVIIAQQLCAVWTVDVCQILAQVDSILLSSVR